MRGFFNIPNVTVTSPAGITGLKNSTISQAFGVIPTSPVAGVVKAFPTNGCTGNLPVDNGQYAGSIVLVPRGSCTFLEKAENLQNFSAIAVVISNNVPGLISIGINPGAPTDTVNIPVVMITQSDGDAIRAQSSPVSMVISNRVAKVPTDLTYTDWKASSLRHWGESIDGTWTLTVEDKFNSGTGSQGQLLSWSLTVWNNNLRADLGSSGAILGPALGMLALLLPLQFVL
jgi:hypothetical protein